MTLDAFPGVTFTGKVSSINTNGVVSSGVTTYPAVIVFDSGNDHIYPNMGVTAKIITNIKNDVILAPSAAVQTAQNSSTIRVMKNGSPRFAGEAGKVTSVPVEIGSSNDTQVEITSGINEGDTVVTGSTGGSARTGTTNGATSPFGAIRGFGGGGFGGGGGARPAGGSGRGG